VIGGALRTHCADDSTVPLIDDDLHVGARGEESRLGDDVDARAVDVDGARGMQIGECDTARSEQRRLMRASDIAAQHETRPLPRDRTTTTRERDDRSDQPDRDEEGESGDADRSGHERGRHDLRLPIDHREHGPTEQCEHPADPHDADARQDQHLDEDEHDAEHDQDDRLPAREPGEHVPEQEGGDRDAAERGTQSQSAPTEHVAHEEPDADREQQARHDAAREHPHEPLRERRSDLDDLTIPEAERIEQRRQIDIDPIRVADPLRLGDIQGQELAGAHQSFHHEIRIDHRLGDRRVASTLERGRAEHGAHGGDGLAVRLLAVPHHRGRGSDDPTGCEMEPLGSDRDERTGAEGITVDVGDGEDARTEEHVAHPQCGIQTPTGRVDAQDERSDPGSLGLGDGALGQRGQSEVDLTVHPQHMDGSVPLRGRRLRERAGEDAHEERTEHCEQTERAAERTEVRRRWHPSTLASSAGPRGRWMRSGQVLARPPREASSPLTSLLQRLGIALLLLLIVALTVWSGRDGYADDTGAPITLLSALYYASVTVTTTGYGDITPVTEGARLATLLVVTPARIGFLLLLVGTTVELLTERWRNDYRRDRWRRRVKDHFVICGYGVKGRAAVAALLADGVEASRIVIVEPKPEVAAQAGTDGLTVVAGDATRTATLLEAAVDRCRAVIVAADRDDSSVLATLTARELAPGATIVAAVREDENKHLLLQSGADSVITSSETAGRLLGISSRRPDMARMVEDLLDTAHGFSLAQRQVGADEAGRPIAERADELPVAIVRGGRVMRIDEPAAQPLQQGDLVMSLTGTDGGGT
jgi:voltage-gated potassium channel